jgi:hypothetical protein
MTVGARFAAGARAMETGISTMRLLLLMAVVATALVAGRWVAEMLADSVR